MHVSSSFPTSDRSIRWIENLAEQEALLGQSDGAYDLCSTRDEILLSETVNFLNELRYHLEFMVRLFNGKINGDRNLVKISKSPSPFDGFSLIRNNIECRIGSKKSGAVHLNCARSESVLTTALVEASFSSFHDVEWVFLGEKVTSEKIARHFLTEFLQLSRGV